ncbi:MAG: non-canonical purine NTP pyrophosphatase [Leifsonia sp.]
MEVVLATHNAHKVGEFQRILGAAMPDVTVVAYDGPEPVEDGTSFAENALIKARTAAAHTGLVALADDSGICVDILGGAPGIFSARWAGGRAVTGANTDVANLELLLAQLADIPDPHRGAHFACAIAVVVPEAPGRLGWEDVALGDWPGRLATQAAGGGGFGYDPIFLPDGFDVSAAELPADVKNAHSHRARAFAAAIPLLQRVV